AIPELIKALESTNNSHNIRAAAASVLGDIGSKEHDVIKSLIKALKDTHEDVQYKATIALEKLGVAAVSTVVQNL
ncbi:HEAT repeat domain-containing protein, partial [Nostoc sp. NIES-2111]